MTFRIHEVTSTEDLENVKGLFRRYADWLETDHGISPDTHGIDTELRKLPKPYSAPDGALICGTSLQGVCVGCIALRRLDDESCEVKRLYVLPEMRGQRMGEALVEALVKKAGTLGYTSIVLDVGDYQAPARALYAKCGFKEVSPKDHIAYPGAVFMARDT